MKLWILGFVLFLLAAAVQSDYNEEFQKVNMACRAESHVSEDDLKAFFKGEKKDATINGLKCHMKCLMEKQGHWNNGGYDSAAALAHLQEMPNLKGHQKEIAKILEECQDIKGADECDTAYLITKCFVEHHPASK